MGTTRLEAFSDGVIAIIITIMVLELKAPHGSDLQALLPIVPVFFSYVLSFAFVGIYWNNHHHMLHAVEKVSGAALWANLHLLFWLSLIPFVTAWMDENHFAAAPVALYGVILFMSAVAYYVLARALIRDNGPDCALAAAFGKDKKGRWSIVLYAFGVLATFWNSWLAITLYVIVAIIWFIPDRRIERDPRIQHPLRG
jgi:uncharacterized membrane protein